MNEPEDPANNMSVQTCGGRDFITKPLLLVDRGNYVVCGGERTVTFFSSATGLPVKTLHTGEILNICMTESPGEIVVAGPKKVTVWNYETARVVNQYRYFKNSSECKSNNKEVEDVFIPMNFTTSGDIYLTVTEKTKSNLLRLNTKEGNCTLLFKKVSPGTQHMGDNNNTLLTLAFDQNHGFQNRKVLCYDRKHTLVQHYNADRERPFTIVRCHPTEKKFACGDSSGRILIFSGLGTQEKLSVATSILHWHSLPVTALCWSLEGNHIFSGGGEHVLCKWFPEDNQKPSFLPRLSSSIVDIDISETVTAVKLQSNSVLLLDQQDVPCGELLGLSRNSSGWPAGLAWDQRSQTLLLNGNTGHIQVFNPETQDTSSIDITQQNFLTQEREKNPLNAEVFKLAVSKCGLYLATMDCCWTPVHRLNLKFWQFDLATHRFVLNTQVDTPHKNGVKTLVFNPRMDNNPPMLLSVGNDRVSKIWTCDASSWECKFSLDFRGLECGTGAWSADGSVLAICFGQVITLWDNQATLKTTLSIGGKTDPIKYLVFGTGVKQEFYMYGASDKTLCAWNLLSLQKIKERNFDDTILNLVCDSDTGDVAVLTKESISIFKNMLSDEIQFTGVNTTGGAVYGKICNSSCLFFITYDGIIKALGKKLKEPEKSEYQPINSSAAFSNKSFLFSSTKSSTTPIEIAGEKRKSTSSDLESILAVPLHAVPANCAMASSFISNRVKNLPKSRITPNTDVLENKSHGKVDEEIRIKKVFSKKSAELSPGFNDFLILLTKGNQ